MKNGNVATLLLRNDRVMAPKRKAASDAPAAAAVESDGVNVTIEAW